MSLADDARNWTKEGREKRWCKAQEKVLKSWDKALAEIKRQALAGNDTAFLDYKNVPMKNWSYKDFDALVVRLQNHGFRARYEDSTVYCWWRQD